MSKRYLFLPLIAFYAMSCALGADDSAPLPGPPAVSSRGLINDDLPSWLTLGVQERLRSEGQHGIGFSEGDNEDFLYQRFRFSVGVRPTNWLNFYGEVQDSRIVGYSRPDASMRDTFDLRQAFVDIGHEGGWWDLKVGRQKMTFGSERLVGASEWGNVPRVFDAARLGIHRGQDRLDLFASSVVNSDMDAQDHHQEGNNLYGAYASMGSWIPNSKIEPYFLWRVSPRYIGEPGMAGRYDSGTFGVRAAGGFQKYWTYETEIIGQRGTIANTPLHGWAYLAQVNRQIQALPWKATLAGEFNYASGDNHPNDGVVNTFDQLYPTNHLIYGVTDQQGRRNAENARVGLRLQPRKWLTIRAEERWLWLASRFDALYQFNGAITVPAVPTGALYRDVGHEFALVGDIVTSKYYNIGAQWGHLTPGKFLETYSPGAGRTFYAFFVDLHI
jgi:hypothetical protein